MFRRISQASLILTLAAYVAATTAAFPGGSDKNNSSSGGGNKSGGNSASGGNTTAGGSNNRTTGANNGSKAGPGSGITLPGGNNSGAVRINPNPGSRQGSSGPVILGSGGSSSSKIVLKSNPPPKVAKSNDAKNVLSSKDHSSDHKDNGSKGTGKDHSGDKHYKGNPHYTYHHEKGKKWDKDEWNHCWYRWWYFHNSHQFINGSWCWWDPDVSQWTVYREGESIAEDYLVKDETPPAASAAIRIELPGDSEAPLSYTLNEYNFQIKPGDHQDLTTDRTWVIAFNRGGDFGDAEYTLDSGVYTFGPSDHGWELFHAE